MRLRRRNFTLDDYDYDFPAFMCVVAVILFFFSAFISLAIFGTDAETNDDAASARQSIIDSFNGDSVVSPNSIVLSIQTLDANGATILSDAVADQQYTSQQLLSLMYDAVNATQPLSLDTSKTDWGEYWGGWLPIIAGIIIFLLLLGLFGWYVATSYERGHFLTDVPKGRYSMYLFLFVTLLPVGWIVYTIDGICQYRFRRNNETTPQVGVRQDAHRYMYEEDDYLYDRFRDLNHSLIRDRKFAVQDITDASEKYIESRVRNHGKQLKERTTQLQHDIESSEDSLKMYGQQLELTQRNRSAYKRELEDVLATPENKEVLQTQAEAEFEMLQKLHNVTAIAVIDHKLHLKVEVKVPYQDSLYDFGDWELIFGSRKLHSRRLRSALHKNAGGRYPDYAYPDGSFCFGYAGTEVSSLLQTGRVVEAASVAVNALHQVNNESEWARVPSTFRKVKA